MLVVTITRKRDIGGAPNDTRFGEHARADDTITLNLSSSLANQRFEAGFERVAAYVEAHGTASVPQMYVEPDGYKTGMFVMSLRQRHARGDRIDPTQRQRLEALPGWVWNAKEAKYKAALNHLRQYVAKTGTATPRKDYRTDDGFKLGEWVGDQREAFTGSERRKMTPERMAELEALPGWSWNAREERFTTGVSHLNRYVAEHGTARVPSSYITAGGFKLGRWVLKLRQAGPSPDGEGRKMTSERRAELEALPGWTWDAQSTKFEAGLDHLRRYVAKAGTAKTPTGYTTGDGFNLGRWIHAQRYAMTTNKLSPERKAALEAIPGWAWGVKATPVTPAFTPKRDPFERGLELMRAYITEHGNADVPTGYNRPSDVFNLGIWAKNQRAATKPGSKRTMTAAHRAALEALPGWSESLRWKKTRDQV